MKRVNIMIAEITTLNKAVKIGTIRIYLNT